MLEIAHSNHTRSTVFCSPTSWGNELQKLKSYKVWSLCGRLAIKLRESLDIFRQFKTLRKDKVSLWTSPGPTRFSTSIQMRRINFWGFFILPFHVFRLYYRPRKSAFFPPWTCAWLSHLRPTAARMSELHFRTKVHSHFAFSSSCDSVCVCAWILPGHHEPHEKIDRVVNVRNSFSSSPPSFHNMFPLMFSAANRDWGWVRDNLWNPLAISRLMESQRAHTFFPA